ncbi:cyclase [Thermococcus chitonophagus]|uniref:Cyclase n=1 Tax=Thermococcus chitonophagus TaxID=54262 RepID=A0A170SKL7_9EURY|nr:cyclase family protein [Thermococcus chitonophagus]ASJ17245.1 cyclase [Thermococcus chitonophagus]CUX77864.1 Metal-dependent hydrolase [Thermococcus chitonophagus]
MGIVDLTMWLGKDTPTFPGDPEVEVTPWAKIGDNGFYMNMIKMGEHSGTHVDAPAHFIEGGETIDRVALEKFIGIGIAIDVRDGDGNIGPHEIPSDIENKVVLLLTGGRELSREAAEKLVKSNIKAVGTDNASIGSHEVHKILLSAGIPIYENLVNLEKLIGKEFLFIGLPLKIKDGSGSPVRAIAIVG